MATPGPWGLAGAAHKRRMSWESGGPTPKRPAHGAGRSGGSCSPRGSGGPTPQRSAHGLGGSGGPSSPGSPRSPGGSGGPSWSSGPAPQSPVPAVSSAPASSSRQATVADIDGLPSINALNISKLSTISDGDIDRWGNLEMGSDLPAQGKITSIQKEAWLDTVAYWKKGFDPEGKWRPERVLGSGAFGITGLWRYRQDPREPGLSDRIARETKGAIVVKQARVEFMSDADGLKQEAEHQIMLMETGSQHIPKVYSFVNRDLGQGTGGLNIDHKNHEVHRIFMEYCIGDLDGMIKKLRRDNAFLEEYELWSIFVCLAKVVSLLDCGNEKAEQPAAGTPWKDSTLIHFDIKTSNMFLGEREARGDEPNPETDEHIMYERILLGDFGQAAWIPRNHSYKITKEHAWKNSIKAPEQYTRKMYDELGNSLDVRDIPISPELPVRDRRYAAWTNIHGIGTLMYCLMTKKSDFQIRYFEQETSKLNDHLQRCPTRGNDLEQLGHNYSNDLKALVLECLIVRPRDRPNVADLLRRALEGFEASRPDVEPAVWADISHAASAARHAPGLQPNELRHLLRDYHGDEPSPSSWDAMLPEREALIPNAVARAQLLATARERQAAREAEVVHADEELQDDPPQEGAAKFNLWVSVFLPDMRLWFRQQFNLRSTSTVRAIKNNIVKVAAAKVAARIEALGEEDQECFSIPTVEELRLSDGGLCDDVGTEDWDHDDDLTMAEILIDGRGGHNHLEMHVRPNGVEDSERDDGRLHTRVEEDSWVGNEL